MKKTLTVLTTILCLSGATTLGQEEERFRRGEWDVSPYATYVDKANDDWGVGASATYFLTEHIGVGGTTYWTDWGGSFIDNMSAEGYFRLPLLKIIAPYAVSSFGYQFDANEVIGSLGAGVDFRPLEKLSAFSDIQHRFAEKTRGGVFIRLGVRFAF